MRNTLWKQMISSLKNITAENGDERHILENYKAISIGMISLIACLFLYAIITETLSIQFDIVSPFTFSQELFGIVGVVCFACVVILCKKCAISNVTPFGIAFMGITFPSFLLANIPMIIFKGHEKITSLLAIFLIPLISIIIYSILNSIYLHYLKLFDSNNTSDD